MGRKQKYRNDAEKMKAYRARKKSENWSDDLILRVDALRKNVHALQQKNMVFSPKIEVYRTSFGNTTYKLLSFVYEWMRFDADVFTAIASDLYLASETQDTKIYRFK